MNLDLARRDHLSVKRQPVGRHWIVCQLGAREDYMVARALAASGRLEALITDAWYEPGSLPARTSVRLRGRYHPQLAGNRVEAFGYKGIAHEIFDLCTVADQWRSIMNRNARFAEMAARRLYALVHSGVPCDTVFAYSYAAEAIFKAARSLGLTTILGQIDPGPLEDELVRDAYLEAGQGHCHAMVPQDYWSRWREEIALSDIVMANSEWSENWLVRASVPKEKISVVPLALDGPERTVRREHMLPHEFTPERPLRLLFLGQVTFRKGIAPLLEALRDIPRAPLQLDIVGELQADLSAFIRVDSRVTVHGAVPRSAVHRFYEAADLFLFPTLSDGFGLTQLEALAHRLPVLTSRNCGNVIAHGHNGFVLDEVTPQAIAAVLLDLLAHPDCLRHWSSNASIPYAFSQEALAAALSELTVADRSYVENC
jgi:glycosyltransferase involved in cell wall biosynthesis